MMLQPEEFVDGIHDLGGMHGFGPVLREESEPVFHAPWEGAVVAMMRAARTRGIFNVDEMRHAIERMDPADYLSSSYYERWLAALERLLIEKGVTTLSEVESPPARPEAKATNAPSIALDRYSRSQTSFRPAVTQPAFRVGQKVITSEVRKHDHTRLPRYARGKQGVVSTLLGTHVFPDASAHGHGEEPQPLYSVRFESTELWGTADGASAVYLDLWESYLAPAPEAGGAHG